MRYHYAPDSEAAHARETLPAAPPAPAFQVLQPATDVLGSQWPSVAVRLQEGGARVRVTAAVAADLQAHLIVESLRVRFAGVLGIMGGYFAWDDGRAAGGRLLAPMPGPALSHARLEVVLGLAEPPPPPEVCPLCRKTVKIKKDGTLYGHRAPSAKPCPLGFTDPAPHGLG